MLNGKNNAINLLNIEILIFRQQNDMKSLDYNVNQTNSTFVDKRKVSFKERRRKKMAKITRKRRFRKSKYILFCNLHIVFILSSLISFSRNCKSKKKTFLDFSNNICHFLVNQKKIVYFLLLLALI